MLAEVDVLVFDIQDVGARFYTYISTLGYVLEGAAEKGIPIVVLDRPNPIGGLQVEGPVTEDSLKSFVGFARVPIRHGMTIGELALMYNGQGWLAGGVRAKLYVVRMENWRRAMWYDQTGLRWIKPSPNMVSLATATVYPGTCLFEGVNVSEGRGSDHPFEYIGAPWLKSAQVLETLARVQLKGVKFETVQFTPTKRAAGTGTPKFSGQGCNGIAVHVVDRQMFEPVRAGLSLIWAIRVLQPEKFEWRESWFDRLCGTADVRKMLEAGKTPDEAIARWTGALDEFKRLRAKYLLYD
jgi:uncharacterized protein YbbC (DUF1343 family)